MTDQPTPPSGSTPDPKKTPKQNRAEVRQEYLDELTLATEVAMAAEKAEYAAALVEEGITAATVTGLKVKIDEARALVTSTGGKKTEKKAATRSEDQLKEELVLQAGKVQSRAKRAYLPGSLRRKDYHIGEPIGLNRARLEQASLDIITHATQDEKLAVPAELLAKLTAAREAYLTAQGAQNDKKAAAANTRDKMEAKLAEVTTARRDIQYAADSAWPAKIKTHAATRTEFKIPVSRGLR